MEKPEFLAGSEKRFFDFVSSLDEGKIALISHTDLDGIAAAKVANAVLDADIVKFVDYGDLNFELVNKLKEEKVTKIVFTDLFIKEKEFLNGLEKFSDVLIIDHHAFGIDLNSDKTTFLNPGGSNRFCATYLCYYLFSKIKGIENLDWLVACASVSDWAYLENQGFMNSVFEKYNDKFVVNHGEIRKSGVFWDLQWKLNLAIIYWKTKGDIRYVFDSIKDGFEEVGDLLEHAGEVQKEIDDALEKFETERKELNCRFFWEFSPHFKIGSIVSTLISANYWNKTVLIGREDEKYFNFSGRRQDRKEDMNLLMKKLTSDLNDASGGGHIPAAGGHVLVEDKGEVMKRLENLKPWP